VIKRRLFKLSDPQWLEERVEWTQGERDSPVLRCMWENGVSFKYAQSRVIVYARRFFQMGMSFAVILSWINPVTLPPRRIFGLCAQIWIKGGMPIERFRTFDWSAMKKFENVKWPAVSSRNLESLKEEERREKSATTRK
jgi:hypothetical protein